MRKCSSFGLYQVQVALPSGMQILIPEWMLDEDRCRGMEIVERPTLSITALFTLRELVDAQQRTPAQTSTVASEASSPGSAIDEPTTPRLPLAIGSGDPGREIEGPMATVILGGLVTSTLLNLLVLPTLALRYGRFEARQES